MKFTDGKLNVKLVPVGEEDWIEFTWQDTCKDVIFRPVTPKDVEQYAQQWATYLTARPSEPVNGTSLERLPGISKDVAITLRVKGVRTVEQLSDMDDYAADGLGTNGQQYRDIARLYMMAMRAPQILAKEDKRPEGRKAA